MAKKPPRVRMHRSALTMHRSGLDIPQARRAGSVERIRGSALQAIRDRILTRDHGVCRCAECIRTGDVRAAHQVDHRRPLWDGGTETDGNRYAIALDCHQLKTACEQRRRTGRAAWVCTCRRCAVGD